MSRVRIIPNLLVENRKLIKGINFRNHRYVGDPINALKIFNEKEVDELVIFDKSASLKGGPDFEFLKNVCSEAFFPLGYGGGINSLDDVKKLMRIGVEKVIFNSTAFRNPNLVKEAIEYAGAQSVVVSIDYKSKFFGGSSVYIDNGLFDIKKSPLEYAKYIQSLGAGELILTSIDREGSYKGFDIDTLKKISTEITIPVVASGGAGKYDDFHSVISKTNVHAVTAGSLFIFYGPLKAVLINYPSYKTLQDMAGK